MPAAGPETLTMLTTAGTAPARQGRVRRTDTAAPAPRTEAVTLARRVEPVTFAHRVDTAILGLATFLNRWSIPALRVSLGLVFFGFGLLKFFPGASPAEQIVTQTVEALTFGLVHGTGTVVLTAVVETFVGLTLLTGRWLKVGLVVLAVVLVGVMAPAVLFADELFGDGMTLMGQYVLKDIVFVAAAAVVAASALGARLTRDA